MPIISENPLNESAENSNDVSVLFSLSISLSSNDEVVVPCFLISL